MLVIDYREDSVVEGLWFRRVSLYCKIFSITGENNFLHFIDQPYHKLNFGRKMFQIMYIGKILNNSTDIYRKKEADITSSDNLKQGKISMLCTHVSITCC